ncbi:hypothetical protein T492DRAFT_347920 [Pavlovales sp. CCMP2436]|nr:hypothetical protein T492DRAFT_347920 [Pavlovales sp. CCMP2436]
MYAWFFFCFHVFYTIYLLSQLLILSPGRRVRGAATSRGLTAPSETEGSEAGGSPEPLGGSPGYLGSSPGLLDSPGLLSRSPGLAGGRARNPPVFWPGGEPQPPPPRDKEYLQPPPSALGMRPPTSPASPAARSQPPPTPTSTGSYNASYSPGPAGPPRSPSPGVAAERARELVAAILLAASSGSSLHAPPSLAALSPRGLGGGEGGWGEGHPPPRGAREAGFFAPADSQPTTSSDSQPFAELPAGSPLFAAVDALLAAAPRRARLGGGRWTYRAARVLPLADSASVLGVARFGGLRIGFAAGGGGYLAGLVRASAAGGGAPIANEAVVLGEHVSVAEPAMWEHLAAEVGLVLGRGEPAAAEWLHARKAGLREARWRVVVVLAAPGPSVPRLRACERCFAHRARRADAERGLPPRATAVTFSLPCELCGRARAEGEDPPEGRTPSAAATERLLAVLARSRWLPLFLLEFVMLRETGAR